MTSRQLRTERRAAERKAQKLARKAKTQSAAPSTIQFVSPPGLSDDHFVSQNEAIPEPALRPGHSTGPRTTQGKLTSSRNSLKHGLASATLVIPGEDPAAYQEVLESLLAEHAPADHTEELLVEQMAQSHWLSQRAIRLQNECFLEDGVDEKRLALFLRYFATHERAFHKALNSLMRLQKERRKLETQFVSQMPESAADEPAVQEIQAPRSAFHFSEADTQARFVSQKSQNRSDGTHFVSQNEPHEVDAAQFVSQKDGFPRARKDTRATMAA